MSSLASGSFIFAAVTASRIGGAGWGAGDAHATSDTTDNLLIGQNHLKTARLAEHFFLSALYITNNYLPTSILRIHVQVFEGSQNQTSYLAIYGLVLL